MLQDETDAEKAFKRVLRLALKIDEMGWNFFVVCGVYRNKGVILKSSDGYYVAEGNGPIQWSVDI